MGPLKQNRMRWSPTPVFTHTKLTKKWLTFLIEKLYENIGNVAILKHYEKVNWVVNWLTFWLTILYTRGGFEIF